MKRLQLAALILTSLLTMACESEWDKLNSQRTKLAEEIRTATQSEWLKVACPEMQRLERRLVEIARERKTSLLPAFLNGRCDAFYTPS